MQTINSRIAISLADYADACSIAFAFRLRNVCTPAAVTPMASITSHVEGSGTDAS